MAQNVFTAAEEIGYQPSVASDDQLAKSFGRAIWQDAVENGTRVSIWKAEPGKYTFPARNLEEVFVVMEGEATCSIDDGVEFKVSPGSIAIVPMGSKIFLDVTSLLKKAAIVVPKPAADS